MGHMVKIIGEHEVSLSLGEPVKNGKDKLHIAIPGLLESKAHLVLDGSSIRATVLT